MTTAESTLSRKEEFSWNKSITQECCFNEQFSPIMRRSGKIRDGIDRSLLMVKFKRREL